VDEFRIPYLAQLLALTFRRVSERKSRSLIVTNYARGITVPQDRQGLIDALRLGLHQNTLSVVNKRGGISSDDVVRQLIVLQLGLKSVDNGAAVRLRNQIGAVLAQNRFPQQGPAPETG
jgi:hypothetical protein